MFYIEFLSNLWCVVFENCCDVAFSCEFMASSALQ